MNHSAGLLATCEYDLAYGRGLFFKSWGTSLLAQNWTTTVITASLHCSRYYCFSQFITTAFLPTSMVSVYLFVPNLIGYTRVALMLISFYVAFDNWKAFIFCYFWSQMLDAFDGAAARRFNECSMFGAVLDMVTDRISSNILALILSHFYPTLYLPLVMFAVVDYASHWTQMYSSVLAKNGSHKYIAPNRPWLLRKYYGSRVMLFTLCFAQEAVLVLMYLYHFVALPTAAFPVWMQQAVYYAALAFLPIALLKQVINVIQLIDAGHEIVKIDEASRAEKVE